MQTSAALIDPHRCLMDVNNVMEVLDRISLFGGLTGSQLQRLLHGMTQVSYRRGEIIYRRGEPASNIYIVLAGSIQLDFGNTNHPLSNHELLAGTCFGETSVIGIQAHGATAVVTQDSQLLELGKEQLMDLFAEDKELFSQLVLNIAREACRRLQQANELLTRPLT